MSVRRKKDGTLFVDIDYQHAAGRRERVRKRSPVPTVRGAEQYERQIRQALLEGTYRPEGKDEEKKLVPTLAEFKPDFMANYAKVNNRAQEVDKKEEILRIHLLPVFQHKRLDEIGARDIE